jgi:hypothetical protein
MASALGAVPEAVVGTPVNKKLPAFLPNYRRLVPNRERLLNIEMRAFQRVPFRRHFPHPRPGRRQWATTVSTSPS